MFQTATIPSGSFSAAGFLLYDAQLSSGYYHLVGQTLPNSMLGLPYLR